jgi:hypothetical protein
MVLNKEEKRAYMKIYMKNKRANKVSIVEQPIQITMNQPIFEAQEVQEVPLSIPVVQGSSDQSGDLKDQIIANLLQQIEVLKEENKRLRGEHISEAQVVRHVKQKSQVETIELIIPEPKHTVLSDYLNVQFPDSLNIDEFKKQIETAIEDTDLFPIMKASNMPLSRIRKQGETEYDGIQKKNWCCITNVVESILKRELKSDTMPIRRTFIKNNYQHSIKNDNTWSNVDKSVFDKAILELCKHVNWRLQGCFTTVIKKNSVVNTENTRIYKKTHQYNSQHLPMWFNLEVGSITAEELYLHVSKSIEKFVSLDMN